MKTIPEQFPDLYSDCYDFSPPTGWEAIVRRASEKLALLPEVKVVQVKDKFAGLRMYYNGFCEEAEVIIRQAELEASQSCEDCGEPGVGRRKGGWYYRSCEAHKK